MLWCKLSAGTIFLFDDKLFLRTTTGILSLDDYAPVGLHKDVSVEPIGTLQCKRVSENHLKFFFAPLATERNN